MPAPAHNDILQGTLDMLVLKALQLGPMHGYGIAELLKHGSGQVFQVGEGSLYPALYRLERQAFIASEWRLTENKRKARYYALTPSGRARLSACGWPDSGSRPASPRRFSSRASCGRSSSASRRMIH